jgi:hypothetical protein
MLFAQSIMELALAALLYHFDWELPHGVKPEKLDMTEQMGLAVGRKNDLYLFRKTKVPLDGAISGFKRHLVVLTKVGRWARSKGSLPKTVVHIYGTYIKPYDTFVTRNN